MFALHRDLIALRQEEPAFDVRRQRQIDGAVLGENAFVIRYFAAGEEGNGDRLLLVNLGRDLILVPAPEPLLAPPECMRWEVQWSSEDPRPTAAAARRRRRPRLAAGGSWETRRWW